MKNLIKPTIWLAACALATAPLAAETGDDKTKLFEPYAPKPSGQSPVGWEIQMLKGSSIESKTTLKNGREIKVNAPAYEMVPSAGAVVLLEPGFNPALGNAQKLTIGALITQYSETAAEMQKSLDKTLAEMEKGLAGDQRKVAPSGAPAPKPDDKKRKTEATSTKQASTPTNAR